MQWWWSGLDADFAMGPDCNRFRGEAAERLRLEQPRFGRICLKALVDNQESLPSLQGDSCHPLH